MTALQTSLRHALIAIAEADAELRVLCDRDSGFVVSWRDLGSVTKFPVIALQIVTHSDVLGTGDRRELTAQLTAVAEGNGAQDAVEAITARLRARTLFTTTAITARGIDAAVTGHVSRSDEAPGPLLANRVSDTVDITLLAHNAPLVAIS